MYIISPARQLLERKQKPVQVGILRIACPTEDIYEGVTHCWTHP